MAMKVYHVKSSPDCFALLPADREKWRKLRLFQLERMRDEWGGSMSFYVRDPARTTEMDFFNVHIGALAFSRNVFEGDLGEIIERSGEVLPAWIDGVGRDICILNTVACYNCLDRGSSKMRTTPDGSVVIQLEKHVFHPERIGDQNLFKIPETKNTMIYALSGRDEPADEFYYQYFNGSYSGLVFEEVWSDK